MDIDLTKHARVLIVDDEEPSASGLERAVRHAGYDICMTVTDPREVAKRFRVLNPDIILLDLHMEPVSGLDVIRQLKEKYGQDELPPIVVLTADTTDEARRAALEAGAVDFLSKPLDTSEVLLRVRNHLRTRALRLQCKNINHVLEGIVAERTIELQKRTNELEQTIVKLQETQQQVMQEERLRALGTMASGIAHDLNNALHLILGFGDLLSGHAALTGDPSARDCLAVMMRAAQDGSQMVKRLKEFYRPRSASEERTAVDVNDLAQQALVFTSPRWECQAQADGVVFEVVKDFGDVPQIAGAPAELRTVLTNLIFNALDAMPAGGILTLRTRDESGAVRLDVEDTGTGMTEETQKHCLEPFYTTKGKDGSGMGLSVSYGIVRRHRGAIHIETALGKGTTFSVKLPVGERIENDVAKPAASRADHPLRVLVVDDHPAIREVVGAYLAEDRHIVETAASGAEALEKFSAGGFDLVITDRAMPEMSGDELAAAIKGIAPREPVILLTGFADVIEETGDYSDKIDLVLGKPARLDDLRRAINTVMADR